MSKNKQGIINSTPATSISQISDENLQKFVNEFMQISMIGIAETLAGEGEKPRPQIIKKYLGKKAKASNIGTVIERFMLKTDDRSKKKLIGQLLSRAPSGNRLSPAKMRYVRKFFDPKNKTHILDRIDLERHFGPILRPAKPIKPSDRDGWFKHFGQLGTAIYNPTGGTVYSPGSGSGTPVQQYTTLRFRVHNIICDDDTREAAQDEIAIAGILAEGPSGTNMNQTTPSSTDIFRQFDVGQFRSGDTKSYNPPMGIGRFDLTQLDFPRVFNVNIAMAEIDQGGFAEFVEELYEAIEEDLTAIIVAVSASLASSIVSALGTGGVLGSVGGPLGSLIGALAGLIIGGLIALISNAMRDDIFPTRSDAVELMSRTDNFNGSNTTPIETFTFADHGGTYRLEYSWKLER